MSGRAAGLAAALAIAACGVPRPDAAPPALVEPAGEQPLPPRARFFHGPPDEAFWVTRRAGASRVVVAGGARLELAPSGEVLAAAWDGERARSGDPITGALAAPERLGGGFVHWSRSRVFRSRAFTGPLEPVAAALGESAIQGARSDLGSIVVLTEAGPRALLPGSARLGPWSEPAVVDAAALDGARALRLDVSGRASATGDGGKTWIDLSPAAGIGVRSISVGEADLWIETFLGVHAVGPGAALEPAARLRARDAERACQITWNDELAAGDDEPPWSPRGTTPLQQAMLDGAALADGTAFAAKGNMVARVDPASGKVVSLHPDWFPAGLECEPLRAPDGVLFACAWHRSEGYGAYVFRSRAGEPPALERAFTDDGGFVGDDDGALGFVGSCSAAARTVDLEDPSRSEGESPDASLGRILCVRRGPGEWVERRVSASQGTAIVAWIPRLDGTAAAVALSSEPLPPRAPDPWCAGGSCPAPRVAEQGGARLVRVYREIPGWSFARAPWLDAARGSISPIDRRFSLRDDGSIDGWLTIDQQPYAQVLAGVTIDPDGTPLVRDVAPGVETMTAGGRFGVAIARSGAMFETTDHGRTWRAAGTSPVPPGAMGSSGCSALGCALGPVARVGWGESRLAPEVSTEPLPDEARAPEAATPRLVCTARGAPEPIAEPPLPPGTRQTLGTAWGEPIDVVRDADVPEPSPPPARRARFAAVAASAAPSSPPPPPGGRKQPPRPSPAVLRTHTLVVRAPFDVRGAPRRLNATDASFGSQRRAQITPLLGASDEVDLLVTGDQSELLVGRDRIAALPPFESTRLGRTDSARGGLSTAGGRALVLGYTRRRITVEDHGPGPATAPIFLGPERDGARRRPMTLGRRDDGEAGVLVFDGAAPETAGVAALPRASASASPFVRLAPWSSLTAADDPRCRKGADRDAYRALVLIDAAAWLAIDPVALPGVTLSHPGMVLVRWGRDRVCLEALEATVIDARRRGDGARRWSLVARWDGRDRGAALRSPDMRQELVCRVEPSAGR